MIHCMLDLETWGTAPGCAVRSIGAVAFDPESSDLGPTFYANISTQSCLDVGLLIDAETVKWWAGQSDDARGALETGQAQLPKVAHWFAYWYEQNAAVAVWSHGLTFDVPVWEAACRALSPRGRVPWGYRDGRDTRTLFSLVPDFRTDSIPFEGVQHDALADARHQARLVQRAHQLLRLPIESEREAYRICSANLRAKDAAMGVLFERLSAAGVDCSDLIS